MRLSKLAPLVLIVSACSAGAEMDTISSSADELRVRPVGSDDAARLVLRLPPGTCLPGAGCARPLAAIPALKVDGVSVTLGGTTSLAPGSHTLSVDGAVATLALARGEVRSFDLPVTRRVCSIPSVPKVDFGPTPTLDAHELARACPTTSREGVKIVQWAAPPSFQYLKGTALVNVPLGTCDALQFPPSALQIYAMGSTLADRSPASLVAACKAMLNADCRGLAGYVVQPSREYARTSCFNQANAGSFAIAPGRYTFDVGADADARVVEEVITEGSTADLVFGMTLDLPATFVTTVVADGAAELPEAPGAPTPFLSCGGGSSKSAYLSNWGGERLSFTAFRDQGCAPTVTAGGRSSTFVPATAGEVHLARLDVDDVELTHADGSPATTVPGSFDLFFAGKRVVGPLPTHHGVWVLPGEYEMVVRYNTAFGEKTARSTVLL